MTPKIAEYHNSDAVTLYLMQSKLKQLIKMYGYKTEKALRKIPFLTDETLRKLNELYESGDYETVIFSLMNARQTTTYQK